MLLCASKFATAEIECSFEMGSKHLWGYHLFCCWLYMQMPLFKMHKCFSFALLTKVGQIIINALFLNKHIFITNKKSKILMNILITFSIKRGIASVWKYESFSFCMSLIFAVRVLVKFVLLRMLPVNYYREEILMKQYKYFVIA